MMFQLMNWRKGMILLVRLQVFIRTTSWQIKGEAGVYTIAFNTKLSVAVVGCGTNRISA